MEYYVGFGCEGFMLNSEDLSVYGNVTCDGNDCDYALMFQPIDNDNGTFNGTQYAWNGTYSPTTAPTAEPSNEPTMNPIYDDCDLESYQAMAVAMGCFDDTHYECDDDTVSMTLYAGTGNCNVSAGTAVTSFDWEETCVEWQCYDAGESFEYNETDDMVNMTNITYLYDGFANVYYYDTFDNGTCDYSNYSVTSLNLNLGCMDGTPFIGNPFGIDLYCLGETLYSMHGLALIARELRHRREPFLLILRMLAVVT